MTYYEYKFVRQREEVARLKRENKRLLDGSGDMFNELFGMGRKR